MFKFGLYLHSYFVYASRIGSGLPGSPLLDFMINNSTSCAGSLIMFDIFDALIEPSIRKDLIQFWQ